MSVLAFYRMSPLGTSRRFAAVRQLVRFRGQGDIEPTVGQRDLWGPCWFDFFRSDEHHDPEVFDEWRAVGAEI
jgi:hypothetical protein